CDPALQRRADANLGVQSFQRNVPAQSEPGLSWIAVWIQSLHWEFRYRTDRRRRHGSGELRLAGSLPVHPVGKKGRLFRLRTTQSKVLLSSRGFCLETIG